MYYLQPPYPGNQFYSLQKSNMDGSETTKIFLPILKYHADASIVIDESNQKLYVLKPKDRVEIDLIDYSKSEESLEMVSCTCRLTQFIL